MAYLSGCLPLQCMCFIIKLEQLLCDCVFVCSLWCFSRFDVWVGAQVCVEWSASLSDWRVLAWAPSTRQASCEETLQGCKYVDNSACCNVLLSALLQTTSDAVLSKAWHMVSQPQVTQLHVQHATFLLISALSWMFFGFYQTRKQHDKVQNSLD